MHNIIFSDRYLRTPEAARYLGLSSRTLEKHRTYGTGPTYRKLGGRVVYALHDLRAWAELGIRRSTTEPVCSVILPAKPQSSDQIFAVRSALQKC
jgi:predicted DNA-binding transcriptional regulator AlpA